MSSISRSNPARSASDTGDITRTACITLDLENDWYFDDPGYDHLVFNHIDDYIELIQDLDVPITFFAVGRTIERFPRVIEKLENQVDCEFHLHSYQHDTSKSYDFQTEIRNGKDVFESYFGYEPEGYRAPQGNIEPHEFTILEEKGFRFDSSIFPSYRPGVYNNLNKPLHPYRPSSTRELLEIPIGATPITRIPFAHSYLKLFGRPFMKYLEYMTLPSMLVYNTHLHDFYRTASHERLPQPKQAIMKRNMEQSVDLFRWIVNQLRRDGYRFVKMTNMYKEAKHLVAQR